LHHPERKAAERLLITDCLRQAEKRKMRHYGQGQTSKVHLINDSVGFMAVPFSIFGSKVLSRVAKLLRRKAAKAGKGVVEQPGEDDQ
jgi:hypothetical protein